jgi:hypothetical protein
MIPSVPLISSSWVGPMGIDFTNILLASKMTGLELQTSK